ncbi:MAG: hypothetical protein E7057_02375 [Lentisphaerae bacterium]|nr:hypothetical protein [Lentisphaerota bacterium]
MKKFYSLLAAAVCVLMCGCGYTVGSLGHPQLESVAVAPVTNDTLAYNAAATLRGLLCERVTTDGTMKLKSLESADCIIYAKVKKVSYNALNYGTLPNGDDTILANEWNCKVEVVFSLIMPGRGKPLFAERTVSGSSKFINGPNMETSRENALRQALFDAAKTVVSNITEGW